MAAKTKIDVGILTKDPGTAVTPSGTKNRAPLPASAAAVTTGGGAGDPGRSAERQAVAAALALIAQADGVFAPHVQTDGPNAVRHQGSVRQAHEPLIPVIANLIRDQAGIAPASTADDLDAAVAYAGDLKRLETRLGATLDAVRNTRRQVLRAGWKQARLALAVAQHLAKDDTTVAATIAPIRQALKRAPRAVASQEVVTRSAHATVVHQRKIAAAQRRADLAKLVQTVDEARRTGTVPATPAAAVPPPVPAR